MRIIFFLLIGLLIGCHGSYQNIIIDATEQKWMGGRKETGNGTNYSINIIAPENNDNFHIQKICIHNNTVLFNINPSIFEKGDTLTINGYKKDEKCNQINNSIFFKIGTKTSLSFIEKIHEKERLHYP